jgi:hypothetical protein
MSCDQEITLRLEAGDAYEMDGTCRVFDFRSDVVSPPVWLVASLRIFSRILLHFFAKCLACTFLLPLIRKVSSCLAMAVIT